MAALLNKNSIPHGLKRRCQVEKNSPVKFKAIIKVHAVNKQNSSSSKTPIRKRMLRKIQSFPTKEFPSPISNAKVIVQYIQPQHHTEQYIITAAQQQQLEEMHVDSIEYLEKPAKGEDLVVDDQPELPAVKEGDCEDVFYHNAIHCLLDLYKEKYESIIKKSNRDDNDTLDQVWPAIAKVMQECYFEFDAEQIRSKYCVLRQQYFDVRSRNDAEDFEYFAQIHEIYQDPRMDMIAKGVHGEPILNLSYKDEDLVKTKVINDINNKNEFENEDPDLKQTEFINIMDEELQTLEDVSDKQKHEHIIDTRSNQNCKLVALQSATPLKPGADIGGDKERENSSLKRAREGTIKKESVKQRPKLNASPNENLGYEIITPTIVPISPSKFTFYHLNEQQERRHREKILLLKDNQQQQREQLDLVEKSLKLNERIVEQQCILLNELIKRIQLPNII